MTQDDVRAAAEQLVDFHERFAPLFGKEQAQDHAYTYVKGLMVCPSARASSRSPCTSAPARSRVCRSSSPSPPGTTTTSRPRLQAVFADELVPPPSRRPDRRRRGHRRVGFAKKGGHRRRGPAAQRPARQGGQLPGRRLPGRRHPRRVGAARSSACTCPSPGTRSSAPARRAKAHIPEEVPFRTKPQIAAALVRVTWLGIVALDWITADEEYGTDGDLLDELERLEQRYVMEVPVTTTVWTADPASCVPPYSGRGQPPSGRRREAVRGGRGRSRRVCRRRPGARCRCARGRSDRWSSSSRRCGSGRSGTASRGRRSGC